MIDWLIVVCLTSNLKYLIHIQDDNKILKNQFETENKKG